MSEELSECTCAGSEQSTRCPQYRDLVARKSNLYARLRAENSATEKERARLSILAGHLADEKFTMMVRAEAAEAKVLSLTKERDQEKSWADGYRRHIDKLTTKLAQMREVVEAARKHFVAIGKKPMSLAEQELFHSLAALSAPPAPAKEDEKRCHHEASGDPPTFPRDCKVCLRAENLALREERQDLKQITAKLRERIKMIEKYTPAPSDSEEVRALRDDVIEAAMFMRQHANLGHGISTWWDKFNDATDRLAAALAKTAAKGETAPEEGHGK